jgi:hypothetical protein
MSDGIGLVEVLLGLDGFRVLAVNESVDELVITIETDADLVGCARCGVRAEAQDRMPIAIRDLACFGRPARLVWNWTEHSEHVDAQAVITRRAGMEACRQVGENARPVSSVANEFGCVGGR